MSPLLPLIGGRVRAVGAEEASLQLLSDVSLQGLSDLLLRSFLGVALRELSFFALLHVDRETGDLSLDQLLSEDKYPVNVAKDTEKQRADFAHVFIPGARGFLNVVLFPLVL